MMGMDMHSRHVDSGDSRPLGLDRGCPLCHALPDEMCITPSGKPRNDHAARTKERTDAD